MQKEFTKELIERSSMLQKQLLKKATSILKKGQKLVYSTCSILEEENEKQLEIFLEKNKLKIISIDKTPFVEIPLLPSKIEGTLTICPNNLYEGFFVSLLEKV